MTSKYIDNRTKVSGILQIITFFIILFPIFWVIFGIIHGDNEWTLALNYAILGAMFGKIFLNNYTLHHEVVDLRERASALEHKSQNNTIKPF